MTQTINDQYIKCPACGEKIQLSKALMDQIKVDVKSEYDKEFADRLEKVKYNAESVLKKKYESELGDLNSKLAEQDKTIKELNKRETLLAKKERELSAKELEIKSEIEGKVKQQINAIQKKAIEDAKKEKLIEMTDLQTQVKELQDKLSDAQAQELELRKAKRQLDSDKQEFELKKQRELDAAKKEIYKKAKSDSESEYQLQLKDKDLELEQLNKQIEKLRSQQGSQQIRGESQELELEDFLSSKFVNDKIEPVPKGIRGADVVQSVNTRFDQVVGKILWESKRTKSWSDSWISKLKEDQRELKADMAIIVSQALPEGVNNISQIDGVWVVSFSAVYGIALMSRESLMLMHQVRESQVNKNEKAQILYDYMCSIEFQQKMEGIVEAFTTMRSDLEKEKRAIKKHWEKREVQIEKVVKHTSGMYGGLQALIGKALPLIDELEFNDDEDPDTPLLTEEREDVKRSYEKHIEQNGN